MSGNKIKAVAVIAMLLCSFVLIAFGVFGNFVEFKNEQRSATLLSNRFYSLSVKNYTKADEKAVETKVAVEGYNADDVKISYVVNTNSKVFHHPWCGFADEISEENLKLVHNNAYGLIQAGYKPCGRCHP